MASTSVIEDARFCIDADTPALSVVVIGRNEGARLKRCLESVRAADYPSAQLELIYVDSDSSDDSCVLAGSFGANVISLKAVRPTAAAARNAGLHAASHDIIQFLDGDAVLNAGWLKRGLQALSNEHLSCVFGRVEEIDPYASIYNFWAHHDWYVPPGPAAACGGVAMFRREALLRCGGYDASLIAGEERDLCHRLVHQHGGAILSLDEPMALHDIHMLQWRQYWRRCVRTGFAYAQVSRKRPPPSEWRKACVREPAHVILIVLALASCIWLRSPFPIVIYAALMLLVITRNAFRCRERIGGTGRAFLYSIHHYLCKLPISLGIFSVWLRRDKRILVYEKDAH